MCVCVYIYIYIYIHTHTHISLNHLAVYLKLRGFINLKINKNNRTERSLLEVEFRHTDRNLGLPNADQGSITSPESEIHRA